MAKVSVNTDTYFMLVALQLSNNLVRLVFDSDIQENLVRLMTNMCEQKLLSFVLYLKLIKAQ
jgi:hypothetical protein